MLVKESSWRIVLLVKGALASGFLVLLHSISCLSWTNMQNPRRPPLQCLRFLGSSSLRQSPSERSQPKLFNILVVTGEDRDFFDFGGVEWEAGTLGLFSVRIFCLDDCLFILENCSTGQMWGSRESGIFILLYLYMPVSNGNLHHRIDIYCHNPY